MNVSLSVMIRVLYSKLLQNFSHWQIDVGVGGLILMDAGRCCSLRRVRLDSEVFWVSFVVREAFLGFSHRVSLMVVYVDGGRSGECVFSARGDCTALRIAFRRSSEV